MTQQKQVVRFGPLGRFIANGVRKGDTIYLSGQVSLDADGQLVGAGDLLAQARRAYENVVEVLERFGATMDDVVDETVFLVDVASLMAQVEAFTSLRDEVYGGQPQVSQTMVQVAALGMPGLLIEIKCIARV